MKSLLKFTQVTICWLLLLTAAPAAFGQATGKDPAKTKKATPADSGANDAKTKNAADSAILKKYKAPRVFIANIPLTESTDIGIIPKPTTHPVAHQGQGFDVTGIAPNGDLILKMWVWTLKKELPADLKSLRRAAATDQVAGSNRTDKEKIDLYKRIDIISKRTTLNFKQHGDLSIAPLSISATDDNVRYFTLSKDSVDQVSTQEATSQSWDITFGVLTTPFKIRYRKFAFTNNAGIGTAVYFQKKFDRNKNWSWGLVPGFSLTSVTLDAASTNIHADPAPGVALSKNSPVTPITTSTTRPAFTPSFSYVISYKTVNFTIGVGLDLISKPTDIATNANPEAGWIYNGKPWIGIGFGVSLFGNNTGGSSTPAATGQSPKQ